MTPPTGRVGFLFTDVEGSTRRWERYGEAMADALRRHDQILRAEIENRGGYVFKTIGDAFCAAFPSAGDALLAAVAAQRRLERENFQGVDGLHVRMAIHAGETDERDGDYFGSAVNRTARLLSAGHGGQILLTGDACDLALPHLAPGLTLRHLGSLPLRDVKEPERVYQPVAEGLPSEFKPLRAIETPPNNLPRQTTSFVGRHDDLARVEALLDEASLVTITGAGGIGKTRVALEVAAARVCDERDGTWFVDLSAVGEPSLIAGAILAASGGELSTGGDPLDDLLSHLQNREVLLVLDNSEHLVVETAAIVGHIISRCPHVAVLATSRAPLDISGERIYRLSSLDSVSAMRLFEDRARAADPAFRLESKANVVEEICSRLDGIALAIELAAARVRTMSVESLASHLELRLLAGGRDRRPRQQTMRALIDWSYDLLSPEEQRVLRYASIFLRGFTLETAARVCGDGADAWEVLDLLASLVDKSLIVVDPQMERYRLLEPIREYALEKLDGAQELAPARRRHAAAIAALASELYDEWDRGPGGDWLARIESDLANLRAALRWSLEEKNDLELGAGLVANSTVLFLRLGLSSEGVEWARRALQLDGQAPPQTAARLRYGLSMLYSNTASNQECLQEALAALPLYRQAGDSRGVARALSQIASRYATQSQWDAAEPAAREALERARRSGDRRLLADVLRRCASSFENDGSDAVRAAFEESVALFRSLGRDDDTARALTWWGQWEEQAGNYARAVELFVEASQLDRSDEATMFQAIEIASCYLALGEPMRAEPFARRSIPASAKAHYIIGTSLGIAYLAAITADRDPRKAARLFGYARARVHDAGWEFDKPDQATMARLDGALRGSLADAEVARLLNDGATLSEDQAVELALSL